MRETCKGVWDGRTDMESTAVNSNWAGQCEVCTRGEMAMEMGWARKRESEKARRGENLNKGRRQRRRKDEGRREGEQDAWLRQSTSAKGRKDVAKYTRGKSDVPDVLRCTKYENGRNDDDGQWLYSPLGGKGESITNNSNCQLPPPFWIVRTRQAQISKTMRTGEKKSALIMYSSSLQAGRKSTQKTQKAQKRQDNGRAR